MLKALAICPGQMLAFPLQTVGTLAQQIINRGEEGEDEQEEEEEESQLNLIKFYFATTFL